MSNNERFISPTGIAEWPRLNDPDTKFVPEGEYKVALVFKAKEVQKFLEFLDEQHARAVEVIKEENPGKRIKPAEPPYILNEETGDVKVRFKMKAKITSKKTGQTYDMKPVIVDAKGKPCPSVKVGGGSRLKVAFTTAPYYTALVGAGVSLRLQGVQILKLEHGSSGAQDLGFAAEEGFSAEDEDNFGGTGAEAQGQSNQDDDADF